MIGRIAVNHKDNSTKSPVRLGIIGCGSIAMVHGEAAQAIAENVSFVACADQNGAAAKTWAARFGVSAVYNDMIEMVRAESLDGVVLATWPSHHHMHVAALIDAGVRYILCEKSLSVSGPFALGILQKARSAGAVVIEAFMLRHHPLYRQFADLVRAGAVGEIDTIRASFQEYDDESDAPDTAGLHWRRRKVSGGGIAYDGTCYPLHICSHLAHSLPVCVAFDGSTGRYDTLVRLHGYIRYENAITGLIHSSLRAVVGREAEVSGSEASLYLPVAYGFNSPEHVAIRRRTGRSNLTMKEEEIPPPPMGEHEIRLAPRLQLENFAEITRGTAEARIPLVASVVNAFTLDAIIKSAELGATVDVDLPPEVRAEWMETVGS
jgi:predicted dehydrogenase